jgi:hypothetical protein
MARYFQSHWTKVGVILLVLGSGPLFFIIVAADIGLWPDPDPNPIGPGILCGFTLWPAVACIIVGVIRVRRRARAA